ncbi:sugar transferase [Aureimonas sp. AU40]|uniref:sugar transferase n=1 Tax=Aureimonas sp. AU40 TaxID=1637747 RepID=UPI0009EC99D7|nr:sugar transferase [Aureimonas sp. AU40]
MLTGLPTRNLGSRSKPERLTAEPALGWSRFGPSVPGPDSLLRVPSGRSVRREEVSPYLHSRRKRVLDLILAVVILAIVLPLMLHIALLIKLTSRGPVIYTQERGGRHHQPFQVLKFRTMIVAQERPGGFLPQACRGDRRVTAVGRWLRQLSFDELPQLINVIRGEMSLVGPRPHARSHDLYYLGHVAGYARRYACTPGLTGLAQISGARGETVRPSDMQRRVALDLHYIRHASVLYDLMILSRTIALTFHCPNAY